MWQGYSVLGISVALLLLVLDFYLLRKRKIQGRPFVLWFVVGIVLAIFSAIPPSISLILMFVGTESLISAVVGVGFLLFLLTFFYLDYRISELRNKLMKLAIEVSIARFGQDKSNPKETNRKKQEDRQQ